MNGVYLWPFILLALVILGIWDYCESKKKNRQRKTRAERVVNRAARFQETAAASKEGQASSEEEPARWPCEKEALRRKEAVPLLSGKETETEWKRGEWWRLE